MAGPLGPKPYNPNNSIPTTHPSYSWAKGMMGVYKTDLCESYHAETIRRAATRILFRTRKMIFQYQIIFQKVTDRWENPKHFFPHTYCIIISTILQTLSCLSTTSFATSIVIRQFYLLQRIYWLPRLIAVFHLRVPMPEQVRGTTVSCSRKASKARNSLLNCVFDACP